MDAQMQVMMKFWKLAFSLEYVGEKLKNSFTVAGHNGLADKLSLTGIEFFLLAHPPDEN